MATIGGAAGDSPKLETILVDEALEEGTMTSLEAQLLYVCGLLAVSSRTPGAHILCCMLNSDGTPTGTKLQVRSQQRGP